MGFTPFEFDESVGQTEPGRPHVPEGYYLFEAVKAEPTPRDYEKTTGVFVTVKFVEGPNDNPGAGVGREMRDYSQLAGKKTSDGRGTQFGLGQTLGAFGMAAVAKKLPGVRMETYEAFESFCANLTRHIAGKRAVGLVADQPSNTGRGAFSGIDEWLPESEWPTLKNARMSPMVGPRAGTVPATSSNGAASVPPVVGSVTAEVDALFDQ